jgi:hypothetical protein
MKGTTPNKIIIDDVPRYIAYCNEDGWAPIHFECNACGKHDTVDRPYFYISDEGDMIMYLCDSCVRGESADPRSIWHFEARRIDQERK